MTDITPKRPSARVIKLAERANEILEITELEPEPRKTGVPIFIGKSIDHDGNITSYPKRVVWWRQSVARIPATPAALFAYLRGARKRNICLLRGKPANVERQPTKRQSPSNTTARTVATTASSTSRPSCSSSMPTASR